MVCEYGFTKGKLKTYMFDGKLKVGHCTISVKEQTWTITGWYINGDYQHKGLGKELLSNSLHYLRNNIGYPESVEYIWNGSNEYVMDWLESNFNPISKCPLAVQKYSSDDDWMSHVYTLNREAFLAYFNIKK